MAVEIFIEPELQELEQAEVAQEWFEIASQLGLSEQLKHADRSEEKKAPPYMHIDPKTAKIIKTLCPMQTDYKNYKVSTIPLDVLKEIQKAEINGWYSRIHICYDDKSPDPFVVGFTHSEHRWSADMHLIARWGAELLPFEQLQAKAIQRMHDEVKQAAIRLKHELEMILEDVNGFSNQLLGGKDAPVFDFKPEDISKW